MQGFKQCAAVIAGFLAIASGAQAQTSLKWYQDNDGDGWGNPLIYSMSATQPTGYVLNNMDYNDNNSNTSSWNYIGSAGALASASYASATYVALALDSSNVPYVITDDNTSGAMAFKYSGGAWVQLGSTHFTSGNTYNSMAVSKKNGNVYFAFQDNGYKGAVKVYSSGAWSTLGGSDFTPSTATYTSLAIDTAGNVYVAFNDANSSNKASVMKYGSSWAQVGTAGISTGAATYNSMAVSRAGIPYVAFADAGNSGKITVKKYSGGSWVTVGSAGISVGAGTYTSLAIDSTGTPYVAFCDAGSSGKATVLKFNGTSWVAVGSSSTISAGSATYTTLCVDASGVPTVSFSDGNSSSKATVMKFNGTSWSNIVSAGFTSGAVTYMALALSTQGVPYIAFEDGSVTRASAMTVAPIINAPTTPVLSASPASSCTTTSVTLSVTSGTLNDATAWVWYSGSCGGTYVGTGTSITIPSVSTTTNYYCRGENSFFTTQGNCGFVSVKVQTAPTWYRDADGDGWGDAATSVVSCSQPTGYVLNSGDCTDASYTATTWYNVGSAGLTGGAVTYTSMAFDNSNVPYVALKNSSNAGTVFKYSGGAWSTVGSAGFASGPTYISLALSSTGTPYMAYRDNGYKASVMYYTGSTWSYVGTQKFTAGDATYTSLVLDASNTPYIGFCDANVSSKASVMSYNGVAWNYVGSSGFSAGTTSYNCLARDASGNLYMAYEDGANSNKVTVMKYNGVSWSTLGTAGFTPNTSTNVALAVDGAGTPYVAYNDASVSNKASVMKYNGSAWVQVGTAGISTAAATSITLSIDAGNNPYVSYVDAGVSGKNVVMKDSAGTWVRVGNTTGFTPGAATYSSVAIDASGIPWVSFSDANASTSGDLSVMKAAPTSVSPTTPSITASATSITCGGSTTLSVTSGTLNNATNWYWYTGSCGGTLVGTGTSLVVHPVTSPTTYYARGEGACLTNPGTCSGGVSVTVSGAVTVPADISGSTTSICHGGTTTYTDATSGGTWSSSNTAVATVNSSGVITGVSAGTANISYTITNTCGSSTKTKSITVQNAPAAISGASTLCVGAIATLTDTVSGGTWSSTSTSVATINSSGIVSAAGAGTTTISYSLTNGCGTNAATTTITVNAVPTAGTIAASTYNYCVGSGAAITLSETGTVSGTGTLASYNWSGPLGYSTTTSSPSATFTPTTSLSGGTYSLTVTYPGTGCTSSAVSAPYITMASAPAAFSVTGGSSCGASSVTIGLTGSETGVTYQLYKNGVAFGSTVSGTGSALSFGTDTATGTYTIIGTGLAYCTTTMTGSASLNRSATQYNVTGGTGCTTSGVTVGLSNSQSGASYQLYRGSTAVGSAVSGTGSALSFGLQNTAGTYLVTASMSGGCTDTMLGTATVISAVNTYTVTGGTGCTSPGLAIGLSGSQSGVSYQLYNGASTVGSPATGTGSAISFGTLTTSGTYTVQVGATGGCAATTMSGSATISTTPTVIVTPASASVCSGASTSLTASGATTYSWTPSATLSSSTAAAVTATPTTTTTYTVTGTTGSCTATATSAITVNTTPTVTVTPTSASICSGASTSLTASGATTYSWTPSATLSSSTAAAVNATPTTTTTYTVTGTTGTCTATATAAVTVTATPTVTITPSSATICSGTSTSLTASGATTYSWTPSATLSSSTAAAVNATPTTTTTYTVTGTTGSCSSTATRLVTVNATPTVTVTPTSASICSGASTSLTASGATTYSWTPSATLSSSTAAAVNATPTTTTTYTVTGTTGTCTATATAAVTVTATPTVTITPSSATICSGASTSLTASGATTYSWTPSATLSSSTAAAVNATPTTTTTYTVTGTTGSCSSTATRLVTVNATPTVTVTPVSSSICAGSTTSITASGGTTYSWSPSTGISSSTGASVNFTGTTTSTYTITGTASSCSGTNTVTVTVNPRPSVASVTASPTFVVAGSTLTLTSGTVTASGAGTLTSYNWSGPNSYAATGTATSATLTPTTTAASGAYSLSVTYSDGCTSSTVSSSSVTVVNQAPKITSVSPNVAAPGTTVTISGSNFSATNAHNIVYFGAVKATVSSATASSIIVTVPSGATFAPITILNTDISLTGYEDSAFTPVYTNSYFKNDTINFKGYVAFNTTSGAASHPYGAAIGDIDGDGKPDLVVNNLDSSSLSIFINTGSAGSISSSSFILANKITLAGKPNNIKLADIDGDGKLDIVAALTNSNYVEVVRNTTTTTGTPTFASRVDVSAGTIAAVVTVTDFDGDGKSDLAVTLPGGYLGFFRNTSSAGSVSFGTMTTATLGSVPSGVCFADLDGDGKPDFAAVNSGYTGSTYTGTTASMARNTSTAGSISFGTVASLTTGTGPIDIAAADIDGDGKKDILVTNFVSGSLSVFRNVASSGSLTAASFSAKVDFTLSAGAIGVNVADINGDGKIDVVVSNFASNNITVLRNTASSGSISTGSLATGISFATGASPVTVNIGDLDGDGYPDVVVGNGGSNNISVIRNYPLPKILPITGTTTVCVAANTTLSSATSGGAWSASNATATINSTSGVVTGVAQGTDTVYYRVVAGGDTAYASTVVTVNPLPYAGAISGPAIACSGSTITLTDTASGGTWISSNTSVATVAGGVVTPVGTGATVISYSVTNSCGTAVATDTISVNTTPSITLGGTPSVCQGVTAAAIAYTTGSGSPSAYSVTYNAAAHSAGFSDVGSSALTGGAINLAVPAAAPAATYSGTITVTNGSCTSASYGFNINVVAYPTAAITSALQPCAGYSTNVIFAGTTGAVLDYAIDGSASSTVVSGGTFTISTGSVTASHTYELVDIHNGTCTSTYDTTVTINPIAMQWTGAADTNWSNTANWSCGFVPGATDNVTIPAAAPHQPSLATAATGTVKNLTVNSGAVVSVYGTGVLHVKGDFASDGWIAGTGSLSVDGTTAQYIRGKGYVNNLAINNSNTGVTIDTGAHPVVRVALTLSGGTLFTNDSLVLGSDSVITARIAPVTITGAVISGKVQVRQYFEGGHRAFRFWGTPFSNAVSLSQMQQYVDITGTDGAANGFTTTTTNAPSAFYYNPLQGNSALGYDPGWRPFTDIEGSADTNQLNRYEGIRLFVRGSKGEGLNGWSYTPSAVTVAMTGYVNTGSQTIHLSKGTGANQDYNQISNPYASPVDIGTIAYNAKNNGQITGSAIYMWNPYAGPSGNWIAVPITSGTPYYMQAYTSFQVRAAANNDSLVFAETNKVQNATTSVLRSAEEYLRLDVYDGNYNQWDMLRIQFNDKATDGEDNDYDAVKPSSVAAMDFYALSADGKRMAIDALPYQAGKVIPLGLGCGYTQDFIIKASEVNVPMGGKVYLHDKFLSNYTMLQQGTEYHFSITADKATQGAGRFELSLDTPAVHAAQALEVSMTPNPATDEVSISFAANSMQATTVRITDISGVCIYAKDLGAALSGNIHVDLSAYASGIYMVELTSGDQKVMKKLVKE